MKKLLLILLLCLPGFIAVAQTDTAKEAAVPDTGKGILKYDTVKPIRKRSVVKDSLRRLVVLDTAKGEDSSLKAAANFTPLTDTLQDTSISTIKMQAVVTTQKPLDSFYIKLLNNPFFKITGRPVYLVVNERERKSKDEVFYLFAGLLLFLAFIRLVFNRYFQNVFRLFFQPAFRQKQTREQLLQNNLPSLLLNLFYVLSGGAYVSFLLTYYNILHISFWQIFIYSLLSLLVLYLGKYIFLSFAGWVFNAKEAAEAYIFAVYLINKILGVILIPFTVVIAFSQPGLINIAVTASLFIILLLFIYRYLVSFAPVRKEIKVSALHFFFYIFAFEITPLLLIYKTFLIYLDKSL